MNLDYINWYLVELESKLSEAVPLEQQNSLLVETEIHLRSLSEDLQAQGMDLRSTQIAAIERFGTPDQIASRCLSNHSSPSSGRIHMFVKALLAIVSVSAVTYAVQSVNYVELIPYVSYTFAASVACFGLYGFAFKRIPDYRWFMLPLATLFVFGAWIGSQKAFFSPDSSPYPRLMPRQYIRDGYLAFKSEHLISRRNEQAAADKWRDILNKGQGIPAGASLELPHLTYRSMLIWEPKGSKYQKMTIVNPKPRKNQEFGYWNLYASQLAEFPTVSKLTLHGPLSFGIINAQLKEKLIAAHIAQSNRESILDRFRFSLNERIYERTSKIYSALLPTYLMLVFPASLLLSYLLAQLRKAIPTRYRNRRLA